MFCGYRCLSDGMERGRGSIDNFFKKGGGLSIFSVVAVVSGVP
jgi:hypothetical protein